MQTLVRLRGPLAGLWLGVILCLAFMAAPTAFAQLERAQAGRLAGHLFQLEAQLSLVLAILLFIVERTWAARRAEAGQGSRLTLNLLLVLGALFCTVLGYYALQPMMEAARAGQGRLGFGALHGISSGFFALKGLLLLVYSWRLAARD
jgi:hypothetical protein